MTCVNGRLNPDQNTKYKLFAACGGHCQNPNCNTPLFENYRKQYVYIAEMAHIIAATNNGPRADYCTDSDERAKYVNLIMLCPTCHTRIDKSPQDYPVELLRGWKSRHEDEIRNLFGIKAFENRKEARIECIKLMRTNKAVLDTYGPNGPERYNPESSQPRIWTLKVLSEILPNNHAIIRICEDNESLLSERELSTVEVFRQHTQDLTLRHLHDERLVAIRYPEEMNRVFEEL